MKNKKYFYLTTICISFFIVANGQASTKNNVTAKFQNSVQTGLLFGQSGSDPALTISTINGIRLAQWFFGIGAGIDYYGAKRSIPLFANIQRDLFEKTNTVFFYASGGYNLGWLKSDQKQQYVYDYKTKPGLFYEAGAGYKFKFIQSSQAGFSIAYSFKQVKEEYSGAPCSPCQDYTPPVITDSYKYRRLAIKFNWWFL